MTMRTPILKSVLLQRVRSQIKKVSDEIRSEKEAKIEALNRFKEVEFIYDDEGDVIAVKNMQEV